MSAPRPIAILLLAAASALAQIKMTTPQLAGFIRSSVELRHDDKKVAEYVRKIKLSTQLSDRDIEEMIGLGAGARTVQALRELAAASASLPEAPRPAPAEAKPTIPPPPVAVQNKVLEQMTDYARNYVKQLPDFICTQVTRRYYDPSGLEFWKLADTITEKLSFVERKEKYELVLINNRPVPGMSRDQLGGTTSAGEFGTDMLELFDSETRAEFAWDRWSTLRGRRAHVFSYRVRQPRSKFSITYNRQRTVTPGYKGYVFADADTGLILRIAREAENLPPDFPIQKVRQTTDYDFIKIGDREFLLPLKSIARSADERTLVKNEVEFRMYRKFGTESTITFTPDALPDSVTTEKPPQP